MIDVLTELEQRWHAGEPVALATVVSTTNSAPRGPGAAMLVCPDGSVVGSVSGGCVEAAVYAQAEIVNANGVPVLTRYGISDDDAFEAGLTCGGIIDVFVERIDETTFAELGDLISAVRAGRSAAVATVVGGSAALGCRLLLIDDAVGGSLGMAELDNAIAADMRAMSQDGRCGVLEYGADGQFCGEDVQVFIMTFRPRPRMLVFGAIDFAGAVARIGSFLGYRVTVCDARETFATAKRFPQADEVVVDWPHKYLQRAHETGEIDERTVVCVLTHDPKFDVPVLEAALRMPLAYVGAMGSRQTNDDRRASLRERGLGEAELERLHGPIGLDIGGRTPSETAVSIAAEIIAMRTGGSGQPLRDSHGPIHLA